ALYCSDETDPAEVAATIAPLEGVDFSLYREGATAVIVHGARGRARIRRAGSGVSTRFAYEQIDGDPLELAPVVSELQAAQQLDEHGFAADETWLAHTAMHAYPDALANLFAAIQHGDRVLNAADVLVSTRDGYYYGWSALERIVHLHATHGNARRQSTTAFLMSTQRTFAPFVRGSEARPLLRE
ncbi:MAG TPA: hypothetical protein VE821_05405, partial [Pyrinomonadaceae bacterium]|nr:hypothetical protein [Pyrinomonadaceae bacterium]